MKRVITVLLGMVGVVLGSGVFWCLFLLGIETGWLLFIFQELDIRLSDRITLGSFEVGPLLAITAIGGLLGLVVGLNVAARLTKHGGKTKKELKVAESIHDASKYGNIEAVKQHLSAGVDVNAKTKTYGRTPLRWAAWGGHKEIVELLIAKGADVNAQLDDGWTPLNFAIDFKKTEIVDLLRKHGGKTGEELKAEGK